MSPDSWRLLGFAAVGVWAGWCAAALRHDLRIPEAKQWRWFRAVFISFLFILFLTGSAVFYFKGFIVCMLSLCTYLLLTQVRRRDL